VQSLRAVLEHPQTWFQALGVKEGYRFPAAVTLEPLPVPWQVHSPQEVAAFLQSIAKRGSDD